MRRSYVMKSLVDQFRSDPTDNAMRAVIDRACTSKITDDDIAYLATTLGRSGSPRSILRSQSTADLASTGAPSSLSTLLGPLYLRAMGCCVPKLGVPGRPAGGVDVLAQLPGYRVNLTADEVMACIERCGYAHFLANEEYAPLDARLFRFRQKSGTQSIPELAIASLLSKKIAVGLQRVGLDVRVAPHGNFGGTWDEARRNAQRFQRVATLIGIDTVCFLTDARFPYQPFVGRGESLVALSEIFTGTREQSLADHAKLCFAMACATADHPNVDLQGRMAAAEEHFYDNLLAQGSSQDAFDEYVAKVRSGHRFQFVAKDHGFVRVRLDRLRDLVLRFQSAGAGSSAVFPDGMGIVLCRLPGELVRPGDLLATIRVAEEQWHSVERELDNVISTSGTLEIGIGFEKVMNE